MRVVVALLILLIAVPLAELAVIIEVGHAIGALPTIGLLLASSVLGTALVRAQGRLAWRRFRGALAAGRIPATEVVDGALVMLGGALLLAPGFLTDVVGLVLLLPPSRVALRTTLIHTARGRILLSGLHGGGASRRRTRQDYDVDSTAYDIDGSPRRLRR